jgi:hypothetical protein
MREAAVPVRLNAKNNFRAAVNTWTMLSIQENLPVIVVATVTMLVLFWLYRDLQSVKERLATVTYDFPHSETAIVPVAAPATVVAHTPEDGVTMDTKKREKSKAAPPSAKASAADP